MQQLLPPPDSHTTTRNNTYRDKPSSEQQSSFQDRRSTGVTAFQDKQNRPGSTTETKNSSQMQFLRGSLAHQQEDPLSSENENSETDFDQKINEKVEKTKQEANVAKVDDIKSKTLNFVKILVSKEKRRFVQDGFDLDLSYILPNLIAMGYPSQGVEAYYRNSMADVQRFFKSKYDVHYKVYNLCSERMYDTKMLNEANQEFSFDDHNPPPFQMIRDFCEDLQAYLLKDPKNVAAVHCKAGKGRTGVMICCYLVFSGFSKSAYEALVYYGKIRTKDSSKGHGVTIPSQIRYVYYFEHYIKLKRSKKQSLQPALSLKKQREQVYKIFKIRMVTIPNFKKGGFIPNFTVICQGLIFYDYKKAEKPKDNFLRSISYYDFFIFEKDPEKELLVFDDIKIQFYHEDQKKFHFWFNTQFVDSSNTLFLNKDMIDTAASDKTNKYFDKNFSIKVFMTPIDNPKWVKQQFERESKKRKVNEKMPEHIEDLKQENDKLTIEVPQRVESSLHTMLISVAQQMPQPNVKTLL